ncbi:MAG: hypothetical protein F6K21_11165 [Symploca sp. SIO2D2]|nr:hypothetical protein [Symploca sp. SIO2D2]
MEPKNHPVVVHNSSIYGSLSPEFSLAFLPTLPPGPVRSPILSSALNFVNAQKI